MNYTTPVLLENRIANIEAEIDKLELEALTLESDIICHVGTKAHTAYRRALVIQRQMAALWDLRASLYTELTIENRKEENKSFWKKLFRK